VSEWISMGTEKDWIEQHPSYGKHVQYNPDTPIEAIGWRAFKYNVRNWIVESHWRCYRRGRVYENKLQTLRSKFWFSLYWLLRKAT